MLFRRKGCWFALWLAGLLLVSGVGRAASASTDIERRDDDRKLQPDSLTVVRNVMSDMERPRKMSTSLYPVQLQVHGRLVRIQSDYNQILPIYTHSGAFYMAMRLSKGTNWLNGLPRGRYFINNRPVTIK